MLANNRSSVVQLLNHLLLFMTPWTAADQVSLSFTRPSSGEICMQVKKQQLDLDMEQHIRSKLGKE